MLAAWRDDAVAAADAEARVEAELQEALDQARLRAEAAKNRVSELESLADQKDAPGGGVLTISPPNAHERQQLFVRQLIFYAHLASRFADPRSKPAILRQAKYASIIPPAIRAAAPKSLVAAAPPPPPPLPPLSEDTKQALFAKYYDVLPPPNSEERMRQRRLYDKINTFHALAAERTQWNGFLAPGLWQESQPM